MPRRSNKSKRVLLGHVAIASCDDDDDAKSESTPLTLCMHASANLARFDIATEDFACRRWTPESHEKLAGCVLSKMLHIPSFCSISLASDPHSAVSWVLQHALRYLVAQFMLSRHCLCGDFPHILDIVFDLLCPLPRPLRRAREIRLSNHRTHRLLDEPRKSTHDDGTAKRGRHTERQGASLQLSVVQTEPIGVLHDTLSDIKRAIIDAPSHCAASLDYLDYSSLYPTLIYAFSGGAVVEDAMALGTDPTLDRLWTPLLSHSGTQT